MKDTEREFRHPDSDLSVISQPTERLYEAVIGVSSSAILWHMAQVFAAADIGSNTVHLLVASVGTEGLVRLENQSDWLSLGEVVSRHGEIPPEQLSRLIRSLKNFKARAEALKAEKIYVFATEAMRVAKNHDEVCKEIKDRVGLRVELISGRREAELSLQGAELDCSLRGSMLLFEVGGGSAQIAYCNNGEILNEVSLPLGTGRLRADIGIAERVNPGQLERLERIVDDQIRNLPDYFAAHAIGSGGVSRGMIRALHPDGDPDLHIEELRFIAWTASYQAEPTLSLRFGVRTKRAGSLLPGSIVLRKLLERYELSSMRVSEFGVREGAILEMAAKRILGTRV